MFRHLKPRILVIDDEPQIGNLLRAVLEDSGELSVEIATEPYSGLARSKVFKPDLLIVDVNMPGMTGIEFARAIRKESWLRHRPILFFTGIADTHAAAMKAAAEGPAEFLLKGGPTAAIVATVERLVAERLQLFRALSATVPPRFRCA